MNLAASGALGHLPLLLFHACLVDLLAQLAYLHLRVQLAINEAELLLLLIDHHVEFEAAHAGHVLRHSLLVRHALGYFVQLLLEPKILLQSISFVGHVIRVQDAIELPLDIVRVFILPAIQALLPLAIYYLEFLENAELVEVLVGLLLTVNDQVSLFL